MNLTFLTDKTAIGTLGDDVRVGEPNYPVFTLPASNEADLAKFRQLIQEQLTPREGCLSDAFMGELFIETPFRKDIAFLIRWDCLRVLAQFFRHDRSALGYKFPAWLAHPKTSLLPKGCSLPVNCLCPRGFELATDAHPAGNPLLVYATLVFDHQTEERGAIFWDRRGVFHAATSAGELGEAALTTVCGWTCASASNTFTLAPKAAEPAPELPEATITRHPREFLPASFQQPPDYVLRDYVQDGEGKWGFRKKLFVFPTAEAGA